MTEQKTIIIGIAGASASGKTLLAKTIVDEIGTKDVEIISEDSYYKGWGHLSKEERDKINFDHPEAFDHQLLAEHLAELKTGTTVEIPHYDYTTHMRTEETHTVGNHRIIVLEGILLFVEPKIRDELDIMIFMDTPPEICLIRRTKRDTLERGRTMESVFDQYMQTVRPMYLQFVEPSKRYADIIVPRGGQNRIAIDMIKAKMRELIGSGKS